MITSKTCFAVQTKVDNSEIIQHAQLIDVGWLVLVLSSWTKLGLLSNAFKIENQTVMLKQNFQIQSIVFFLILVVKK